jgi:hypothetical protein
MTAHGIILFPSASYAICLCAVPTFSHSKKGASSPSPTNSSAHMPDVSLALIGTTSDDKRTIPDLPSWVNDMRATHMNDDIERAWVAQYARSHIVVGVHGSNMLLPTAHAGASVTLMPIDRWGNMVQDTIVTEPDPRMSQVRHKHIPIDTLPETLARIVVRTYRALPHARQNYERTHTQHNFTID